MIKRMLVAAVRVYQGALSPFLGNCCRFHPSCSKYCITAIEKHGCLKGVWLALRRICRCHPCRPGGVDPVPEPGPAGQKTA